MDTSSDNLSYSPSNSCNPPSQPSYRVIETQHQTVHGVKAQPRVVQVCKQEPPSTPAFAQMPLYDDPKPSVKCEDEEVHIEVKSPSPETTTRLRTPISPRDPNRLDCTQRSGMRLFIHGAERRLANNMERRHEGDVIDTPLAFVRARGQVRSREGSLRTNSAFYRHRPGHVTLHRHPEGRERREAFDDGRYYNVFDEGVDVPYMPESLLKEHAEVIVRLRNVAPLAHFRPVQSEERRNRREDGTRVTKVANDSSTIRRTQTL